MTRPGLALASPRAAAHRRSWPLAGAVASHREEIQTYTILSMAKDREPKSPSLCRLDGRENAQEPASFHPLDLLKPHRHYSELYRLGPIVLDGVIIRAEA
jgi:hypothetical protein